MNIISVPCLKVYFKRRSQGEYAFIRAEHTANLNIARPFKRYPVSFCCGETILTMATTRALHRVVQRTRAMPSINTAFDARVRFHSPWLYFRSFQLALKIQDWPILPSQKHHNITWIESRLIGLFERQGLGKRATGMDGNDISLKGRIFPFRKRLDSTKDLKP